MCDVLQAVCVMWYRHVALMCDVLQACTGGGCQVSNASVATTAESSPEGIAVPVVTSPSPSQLLVTWTPPQFPNGNVSISVCVCVCMYECMCA